MEDEAGRPDDAGGPAASEPPPVSGPSPFAAPYGQPYAQPYAQPYPPPTYAQAYGQPYPPQYPPPYPPTAPRRTDGVSVAALVTGLLLMAPVAIALGIAGILRTRRPEIAGRGLAIAGLVLGCLGMFVGAAVIVAALAANTDTGKEIIGVATGDRVALEDLAVGMCFQEPKDDLAIYTVEVAECSATHDYEVYVVGDVEIADSSAGSPYPGRTALGKAGSTQCSAAFDGFVGTGYDSSDLDFYLILPSEEAWTRDDDRGLICAVYDPDGPTTGSLAGAQR